MILDLRLLKTFIRLVVQKSGKPVDMVVFPIIYIYLQGFSTIQTVVGLGVSEPSTVWYYQYANLWE